MKKSAAAIAEPVPPAPSDLFVPAEAPAEGKIPMAWSDCFARVRYALAAQGRTVVCTEAPTRPGQEIAYLSWELEVCEGGRVKQIDLFARAQELGQVETCEVPVGPGWPE